jgi:glycosyltransferase involved in cell wall biosynthesis
MKRRIALNWPMTEGTAWGETAIRICRALLAEGQTPLLLHDSDIDLLAEDDRAALAPLASALARARAEGGVRLPDGCLILTPFGRGLVSQPVEDRPADSVVVGLGALEETDLGDDARVRGAAFARLVVHSTWNREVLVEAGLEQVGVIHQGIDPARMRPLPRVPRLPGRFVIFSGGKLEFRKGQDIVLAAFRRFHQRYPEAILVTAWHSQWPGLAESIGESRHAPVPPDVDADGRLRMADWVIANGVPPDSFVDLGLLRHAALPAVLAECDLAVFPNRCEGGTNLVAMEAMACGVPVILSANTGHLDLIRPGMCQVLETQRPVADPEGCRTGWGESDVDELVARMEAVRAGPIHAREAANAAVRVMHEEWTWQRFTTRLLEEIDAVG